MSSLDNVMYPFTLEAISELYFVADTNRHSRGRYRESRDLTAWIPDNDLGNDDITTLTGVQNKHSYVVYSVLNISVKSTHHLLYLTIQYDLIEWHDFHQQKGEKR